MMQRHIYSQKEEETEKWNKNLMEERTGGAVEEQTVVTRSSAGSVKWN